MAKTYNKRILSDLFKILLLSFFFLIVSGALYLTLINYQCTKHLKGVPDSNLQFMDGIALLKSTGEPYTGTAYSTVCGGECGFPSCALLHWRAEYKDGKLHGKFNAPTSGVGDKYWFSPGDKTKTYHYEHGKKIR